MLIPTHYTIVSGKGYSEYPLVAFDNALIDAGIGDYNLVKVSSILPADCQYETHIDISRGSIVYAAYATATVSEGQEMSLAVAVAVPSETEESGVIFETSSLDNDAEQIVHAMCCEAMKKRRKLIGDIKSSTITISGKSGMYVCGVSAVIMW
ncbi:pyruvoyl-dependent arginine decarboxylase [Frisingicoccus sp.]|uniref:pyruvoyl-dependent arginine decarboxylase n=1 Tax=Frisingicoccus sp. TaxID=1918627 RepID=UPI003AB76C5B